MTAVKKLGDMLKDAGLIDDFQLESALSHQRNWGGKLGTILVELEFVREEEIARVISENLRIPYVNLFEPEIPESVINLLKTEVAKKYHVIPAKKEKTTLILAMSDPLDIEAIDAIRFVTNLNIKPALAMETEIQNAIKKYYEGEEIVRKSPETPLYHRAHTTGGKMELIRGSDLSMAKQNDESSPILSKDETLQQALQDNKMRVDALITLLIEKEFITREELVNMIYQKKLGL
jgi:type IV pilus assembly protein PilB